MFPEQQSLACFSPVAVMRRGVLKKWDLKAVAGSDSKSSGLLLVPPRIDTESSPADARQDNTSSQNVTLITGTPH
jgi:hypothetical protein